MSHRQELDRIAAYLFERPLAVNCNFCGSDRARLLARIDRHALGVRTVICCRCGLIYTNPRPSDAALARFYQADYRILTREVEVDPERLHRSGLIEGETLVELIARHRAEQVGAVLEIGSAAGGILRAFRDRYQAEVVGVEPTVGLAAYANAHGIRTVVGLVEAVDVPAEAFDLAIMVRTVRHLADPAMTFARVRAALVAGGHFLVECTDVRKYVARHGLRAGLQIDHLYAFTPATLGRLLGACGFEVLIEAPHPADVTRFVILAQRSESRRASYSDAQQIRDEILTAHRVVRRKIYRIPDYVRDVLGDRTVNRIKNVLRWNGQ